MKYIDEDLLFGILTGLAVTAIGIILGCALFVLSGCGPSLHDYQLCHEPSSQWGVSLETDCLVYRQVCDPLPGADESEDTDVLVSRLPMLECYL